MNISKIDGPFSTIAEVNEDNLSPAPVFRTKRLGLVVSSDPNEPPPPVPEKLTPLSNKHFRT